MEYDRTYHGFLAMPNGHYGPWKRVSPMSPLKSAIFESVTGEREVAPVRLMHQVGKAPRPKRMPACQRLLFPRKKEGRSHA